MNYEAFERDFMERTLHIVNDYKGEYKVTLLINCLLGLLVLPAEKLFDRIEETPLHEVLKDWDIPTSAIRNGTCSSLKYLIRRMRHSTAHLDLEFGADKGSIKSITFKHQKGCAHALNFDVELDETDLSKFVMKLPSSLIEIEKTTDETGGQLEGQAESS
ncbi:MAG: HEPN family nuclease [Chloroflexota bacterium]